MSVSPFVRLLALALVLTACGGSSQLELEPEPECRAGFYVVESDDDPHDAGNGVGIYCVAAERRGFWCCK